MSINHVVTIGFGTGSLVGEIKYVTTFGYTLGNIWVVQPDESQNWSGQADEASIWTQQSDETTSWA